MEGFRHMHDGTPVQLIQHLRDALDGSNDIEILVGSDSHNRRTHTVYATTVVLRYQGNGAQVLYRREKASRIPDLWTRLWGEVERSVAVARELTEIGRIPVSRIDMDINSDARFGSQKLHTTAVGYVRSCGYRAHTKPELLIASWAANVLCN